MPLTIEQDRLAKLEQKVLALQTELLRLRTAYEPPLANNAYLCEDLANQVGLKRVTLYRKFKRGQIPQGTIWRYAPDGRIMVNLPALQQWLGSAPQI